MLYYCREVVRYQVHNSTLPHLYTSLCVVHFTTHQLLDAPIHTVVIEDLLVSESSSKGLEEA